MHWDKVYNVDLWIGDDVPYTGMAVWFAEFPGFVCEVADWGRVSPARQRARCEDPLCRRDDRGTVPPRRSTGTKSASPNFAKPGKRRCGSFTALRRPFDKLRMTDDEDLRRVAVFVFPGTNSEDETLRALRAVGLEAELVHWSQPRAARAVRCVRSAGRVRVRGSHSRRGGRGARCADGSGDRRGAGREVRARDLQRSADSRGSGARARDRAAAPADGGVRAERERPVSIGPRARAARRRTEPRPDPGRHRGRTR